MILSAIYGILALGLNLVVGFLGILSVAHGAFFGVGAYTLGILTVKYGVSFWPALGLSTGVAGIIGLSFALPCLGLKGDYLALATFGFAVAAFDLFNNLLDLTRGPMGIPGIPGPELPTLLGGAKPAFLLLTVTLLGLSFFILNRLIRSPWGRILRAIRDQELVVSISGKNVKNYKLTAFMLSSALAGMAGALYASYLSYIHPSNFTPMLSIIALCMTVLGGLGSLAGSLLGAALLVIFPELLRFMPIPNAMAGTLNQFIYGSVMVVMMLRRPQGLLGQYRFEER